MTILDYILVAALVVLLPAEALWKTVARRGQPKAPLAARLAQSLRVVVVLLAFLFMLWSFEQRPLALLGLDWPVSTAGLVGLAASVLILGLLAVAIRLSRRKANEAEAAALAEVMPTNRRETTLFVLFAFAAGIGWELLYRGFLLWVLTPLIGLAGAVVVAAIAYGLGHGSRDAKSLVGAVVASFLFTIGYGVTDSLWWLMLLHTGLALVGLRAGRSVEVKSART